jgi:hypothetical protein
MMAVPPSSGRGLFRSWRERLDLAKLNLAKDPGGSLGNTGWIGSGSFFHGKGLNLTFARFTPYT